MQIVAAQQTMRSSDRGAGQALLVAGLGDCGSIPVFDSRARTEIQGPSQPGSGQAVVGTLGPVSLFSARRQKCWMLTRAGRRVAYGLPATQWTI